MTSEQLLREQSKYQSILELSQDQLAALKSGDMARFRHNLAAKGALIESLKNKESAAKDPRIRTLILQIHRSEADSERLISTRLESIRQELTTLEHTKSARNAYIRSTRKMPTFVPSLDTPIMFDHRS